MFLTIRKISALPRLFSKFLIFFVKILVLRKSFQTILDYSIFFPFLLKIFTSRFLNCFFEEFVPRNFFQFFLPRKISSKNRKPITRFVIFTGKYIFLLIFKDFSYQFGLPISVVNLSHLFLLHNLDLFDLKWPQISNHLASLRFRPPNLQYFIPGFNSE